MARKKGYKEAKREPVDLDFTETAHAGLEASVDVTTTLGVFIDVSDAVTRFQGLATFVDDYVVEWNLEDDAGPIPTTAQGAKRAGLSVIEAVFVGWSEAISAIPANLEPE
tara:strand:+ start:18 stop:347 length:330 start_codon:yes stop_codon:yes gene_type:complete